MQRIGFIFTFFKDKSEIASRLFKFVLIGGLNYPLNIVLVWLITEIVGFDYLLSVIIAYSIITMSNFFWHSGYIFQSKKNKFIFIKYLISIAFFYIAYIFIVKTLTEQLNIYYLFSIIISMSVLFFIKFFLFNNYIFVDTEN